MSNDEAWASADLRHPAVQLRRYPGTGLWRCLLGTYLGTLPQLVLQSGLRGHPVTLAVSISGPSRQDFGWELPIPSHSTPCGPCGSSAHQLRLQPLEDLSAAMQGVPHTCFADLGIFLQYQVRTGALVPSSSKNPVIDGRQY